MLSAGPARKRSINSVHTPQQTSSNIIKSQVVKVCVKQLNFLYRIVLKKDIIKRFSTTFYQKNSALAIYDQAKSVSWIFSISQRYSREKNVSAYSRWLRGVGVNVVVNSAVTDGQLFYFLTIFFNTV